LDTARERRLTGEPDPFQIPRISIPHRFDQEGDGIVLGKGRKVVPDAGAPTLAGGTEGASNGLSPAHRPVDRPPVL
jgi:hypothetical protein